MSGALEGTIHQLLAKSRIAAGLAVKIRNQANCVIGYHLGEAADSEANGEFALLRHIAPEVKTFVDVGANVGAWSDYMLQQAPNSRGFLFEPSSQCVKALDARFQGRDVVTRNIAISNMAGSAEFGEEDNCGETSSLLEGRSETTTAKLTTVTVSTLDSEFQDSGFDIDYLKIDTEGNDLKVMKGASGILSRTRFVQFEYNSYWIAVGSSLAEAIRFLGSHGFSIYLIRSTGLHVLRYGFWGDYFRYSNYFACREGDLDAVRSLLRAPI